MTDRPLDCVGLPLSDGMRGKADFRTFGKTLLPDQVPGIVVTSPADFSIAQLESLLKNYDAARISGFPATALRQLLGCLKAREWQPMDTAPGPKIESGPFLVLVENDFKDPVALQVRWFQGDLYPDHLGGNICWGDRVEGAKGWMPTPAMPRP
ncbi:hypothetical protein TA3x_000379 [Tundrisphaera sp. TA3]|uniref:hypothetical protein n=1 Tax=Tundrisphaera sp. TA3 TaxID=3435775 RepID=UPI003EB90B0D